MLIIGYAVWNSCLMEGNNSWPFLQECYVSARGSIFLLIKMKVVFLFLYALQQRLLKAA